MGGWIGIDIKGGAGGCCGVFGLLTGCLARFLVEVVGVLLGLLLFSLEREMASSFLFFLLARLAAHLWRLCSVLDIIS